MSTSSSGELDTRLSAVEGDLDKLARKINRSGTLVIVVGVVVLALLCGYFYFGYKQISPLLNNEMLLNAVEGQIDSQLPEVRAAIEKQLRTQAPIWAEDLSNRVVSYVPEARAKLEDRAVEAVNKLLDDLVTKTEPQLRSFLVDNRDILQQGFEDLANNEEISEKTLAEIELNLEQKLKANLEEHAEMFLLQLNTLTARAGDLKRGEALDQEAMLARQALMLAKRIQLKAGDPDVLKNIDEQ